MSLREQCSPDFTYASVYEIDPEQLRGMGIHAVIFDIDNTLVPYEDPVAGGKLRSWLEELQEQGLALCLVSNNNKKRVRRFAESVGLPYYSRALKPWKRRLRQACAQMQAAPEHTALVGDQLFTDVLGGNRMGMLTILVAPISDKDTAFVRWKRKMENKLLHGSERGGEL